MISIKWSVENTIYKNFNEPSHHSLVLELVGTRALTAGLERLQNFLWRKSFRALRSLVVSLQGTTHSAATGGTCQASVSGWLAWYVSGPLAVCPGVHQHQSQAQWHRPNIWGMCNTAGHWRTTPWCTGRLLGHYRAQRAWWCTRRAHISWQMQSLVYLPPSQGFYCMLSWYPAWRRNASLQQHPGNLEFGAGGKHLWQ